MVKVCFLDHRALRIQARPDGGIESFTDQHLVNHGALLVQIKSYTWKSMNSVTKGLGEGLSDPFLLVSNLCVITSPCVWSGLKASFLTNRICKSSKMSLLRLGYKKTVASVLLSLFCHLSHLLRESSCHEEVLMAMNCCLHPIARDDGGLPTAT